MYTQNPFSSNTDVGKSWIYSVKCCRVPKRNKTNMHNYDKSVMQMDVSLNQKSAIQAKIFYNETHTKLHE